jgi:hypothetical protein
MSLRAMLHTETHFVQTRYLQAMFYVFISPAIIAGGNINILDITNNAST